MKKVIPSFLLSVLLCFISIKYLEISNFENNYGIVFTYLSIIVGFVITSVTIIGSSSYSKMLYKKQSSVDNSKTLLHELLNNFKFTLLFYTTPMLLILINTLIPWCKFDNLYKDLYTSIILIITMWTFPILYLQFKRILSFILQNSKQYKE